MNLKIFKKHVLLVKIVQAIVDDCLDFAII